MLYGNFRKAKTLRMAKSTRWLIDKHPKEARRYCNGVGSTATFLDRLLYHLIPNGILGVSIVAASQIHDIEYSYPTIFRDKDEADQFKKEADARFYANMIELVYRGPKFLRNFRLDGAKVRYEAVQHFGHGAFEVGKKILK